MGFDEAAAHDAVARFCRTRNVDDVRLTVVGHLDTALDIATLRGPDTRWRTLPFWCPADDPGQSLFGYEFKETLTDAGQAIYERVLEVESRRRRVRSEVWISSNVVVPVSRWARFSRAMRDALDAGLGWLLPVHSELLLVAMPTLRRTEGELGVLHDDTGRPAIEWADGRGNYFLNGVEFTESRYHQVIGGELLIQEIAAFEDADQRAIALTHLSFERLMLDSDAELLDTGSRGTRLYRLPLPFRLRADRVPGYGGYDDFIHMRDASHPEREFVEWVDPAIGRQRNAELCQAHAFGISLEEWLSVEREG